MNEIYGILTLAFFPLFPWRVSRMAEQNPHAFEGPVGEKRAKNIFRFYCVVSILIFVIFPFWQPNQVHILLDLWWIILVGFSGTYGITHKPKIDIAIAKIKKMKWGKKE